MEPRLGAPAGAGTPAGAGLDEERLQRVWDLLDDWVARGLVRGAAVAVSRGPVLVAPRGFGECRRGEYREGMPADAVFLVASVTKPVTATAVMMLVERGQVSLDEPLCSHVPEFSGDGRERVTIRHLLTHTSGLPDMLPENLALRQRHAPLSAFVEGACRCRLLFEPGTRISYQSMGIALLGELVERLSGRALRAFLRDELFAPAGMDSTCLGLESGLRERVADVELPDEQAGASWNWNGDYWRPLGVPWGGMFASVADGLRLLQLFLGEGGMDGRQVLGAATARAMVADQTSLLPGLDEASRRRGAWGLGWRRGWCDLSSARSFSHNGATGTLVGADPENHLACAIFTSRPGAPLGAVANAVCAAAL